MPVAGLKTRNREPFAVFQAHFAAGFAFNVSPVERGLPILPKIFLAIPAHSSIVVSSVR